MSTHYADSPAFETTRKLSTSRSYNDKARDALPGLGGGDGETSCKIGKCDHMQTIIRSWLKGMDER